MATSSLAVWSVSLTRSDREIVRLLILIVGLTARQAWRLPGRDCLAPGQASTTTTTHLPPPGRKKSPLVLVSSGSNGYNHWGFSLATDPTSRRVSLPGSDFSRDFIRPLVSSVIHLANIAINSQTIKSPPFFYLLTAETTSPDPEAPKSTSSTLLR